MAYRQGNLVYDDATRKMIGVVNMDGTVSYVDVRRRRPLALYNQGLNYAINSSVTADASGYYTVELTFQCDSPFFDAGIVLWHYNTSTIAVTKAAIAPSAALSSAWSVISGASVPLTFAGAAGATLPVRVATNVPSMTVSDRVKVASVARSDGGSGYLFRVRVVYQGTPSAVIPFTYNSSQESGTAYKTATGRDWWGAGGAGDGVTTPSVTTNTILANARPIGGVVLTQSGPGVTHAAFGDSITAGQQESLASARGAVVQMCHSLSTAALPHMPANYGWNGATSAQYYQRVLAALTAFDAGTLPMDFCYYLVASQNDSDAVADRQQRTVDVIDRCLARGIVPVLLSPVPLTAATGGVQTNILAMRAFAQTTAAAYSIPWIDQYLALGYADLTTVGYQTAYGTGLHPNEAGQQALGTAWLAVMRGYI